MGVAADDGLVEGEGDGLRESLLKSAGSRAAQTDLLACNSLVEMRYESWMGCVDCTSILGSDFREIQESIRILE